MGELRHDTYFRRQYRKVHGALKLPNFEATSMKVRYSQPFTRMTECLSTALPTDLVDILHGGYSVAYLLFLAGYDHGSCGWTPIEAQINLSPFELHVAVVGSPLAAIRVIVISR